MAGSWAMVTELRIGDCCKAALSEPNRKLRTLEWAPSAPISKFPTTRVPSSNIAVANVLSDSMWSRRLPYYIFVRFHGVHAGLGGLYPNIDSR